MQKISYILLSLMVLLSACSKEENYPSEPLRDNMYRLSVAPETDVKTRATAPDQWGLTTRYILEIYNNGKVYQRMVQANTVFEFRLMTNQTYDFLVWVDYTSNGVDDNHYDTGDGLKSITLKDGDLYANNDHGRDAFFGSLKGQTITTSSKDFGSIPCKRPFGQLNIKTMDWAHTNSDTPNPALKPTKISVSFTAPNAFNVFDGTVSGSQTYSYDYTLSIADQTNDEQALTCDYIFAPAADNNFISPVIVFKNSDGGEITNTASYLETLPVKRNFQTNVSGSLISKKGKVNVAVDAEWSLPSIELTRPEEETASFHIKKNDPNYNPSTGVYTIDPSKIGSQDGKVILVFSGDFPQNITINMPDNMPANVQNIVIDANMVTGKPSINISNENFSGMVSLKHELPAINQNTQIQDLTVNLPNGSFTLGSGLVVNGNMIVTTKSTTFIMEQESVIIGTLTVNGGRAILNGEVTGIIYVYGDSKVDIVKNGVTKSYWTSAIAQKGVSKWYGLGAGVGDVIDLALPGFTLPDFLNLSFDMNYAGAYATFDFGNHTNGLSWKDLRNVNYDFYTANNAKSSAKLKKDLNIVYSTPEDLQSAMNKPINDLKVELNKKVADVKAMLTQYEGALPAGLATAFRTEVNKLGDAVAYFNSQLPSVKLPDGPQIPLATILPSSDNFDFTAISKLIGTPNDKVNLLDIPAYIDGSKPLTLYMVINLLSDYKNNENDLAALKAEKAALEQEKAILNAEKAQINSQISEVKTLPGYILLTNQLNTLVNQYDALPSPVSKTVGWPSYTFTAAQKNTLFESLGGTYFGGEILGQSLMQKWSVIAVGGSANATEVAKMNAKNAKIDQIEAKVIERNAYVATEAGALGVRISAIDARISTIDAKINGTIGQIFTDGLNARILAAETQTSVIAGALTQLGVDKTTVDTIMDVLVAVEPYLSTVADVANTINSTMDKIQAANPWEYKKGITSKTPVTRMEVEAKFEYESGKLLYLYSK